MKKKMIRTVKRLVLLGIGILIGIILWIVINCPDVSALKKENPKQTRLMTYREAQYQAKGMKVAKRWRWIALSRVSPELIQAVLISEDDKFYQHDGFDWEGIREAAEENMRSRRVLRGGSTITQQLAKNLYLTPTRNPVRKLQEAWITEQLERKLTKRRILELYLNVIEWGRGIYGIEAASRYYYHKSASQLTREEAIRLASVLPNPIRYSPGSNSSKRMTYKRKTIALHMMQKHLIDKDEYQRLRALF